MARRDAVFDGLRRRLPQRGRRSAAGAPGVPGGKRAAGALREVGASADAIYLDGFAPAKNPHMWTHQTMRALSRLAAPGATLATWSVAGSVRETLHETGFAVEKRAGFGGKREMLVGRRNGDSHHFSVPERRALVVG